MIILIGGTSCSGKTLMAQNLLEKYKTPYFSMDHLKMGLYRTDENCGFTPMDSNEVIAEKIWPITKAMIMTAIENKSNLIIEGCYLMPELVKDFDEEYLEKITTVFLGFSTDYINNNFETGIIKHRSAIELREYDEERPISQFIEEHNDFLKRCIVNDVRHFEIKSDYEAEIQGVYDFIDEEIK